MSTGLISTFVLCLSWFQAPATPPASSPPLSGADRLTIEVRPGGEKPAPEAPKSCIRVTAETLEAMLDSPDLPPSMKIESEKAAMLAALQRLNMTALVAELTPFLTERFAKNFNPAMDLILAPVAIQRQVSLEAKDLGADPFRGPKNETIGFLLNDITDSEYRQVVVRAMQIARRLMETGNKAYDRTDTAYYAWLAERELKAIRDAKQAEELSKKEAEEIQRRVFAELNITKAEDSPKSLAWFKQSRRFSYIIRKNGEFISRLKPLVEKINREMQISGCLPPSPLDKAGIYFDPEIGDVDIVLPKPMLIAFLLSADEFERRMAEDSIISVEALRLTDRELVEGAVASRVSAEIQGVHDVERYKIKSTVNELGLNALLAVANQNLTANTYSSIAGGALPAGTPPITIAPPTVPPVFTGEEYTTVGATFSYGADPVFFNGQQQTTGFSYIGPDGIAHTMTTDVVDSLRELWSRIERNLIVHKIKKTDGLTDFSVPVGPNSRTYKGIAALISQENQQLIVATGTGAISEIKATAGTWLVIENFTIRPTPGSSTTLTVEEREDLDTRVLLTMMLRDPFVSPASKRHLLDAQSREELRERLAAIYQELEFRPIRPGEYRRTYRLVRDERLKEVIADEEYEKKEKNSMIGLTFFSSQGQIVQSPGATQLGDVNDLTSFTTELKPNTVTPISSFFTKNGTGLTGSSILTGVERGERLNEDKSMTHLIIRARFPTVSRERADRDEGRNLGYFDLPIERRPNSDVDVPMLSSSEHPEERLSKLRVGLLFPVLDYSKVLKPFDKANPNSIPGVVSRGAWETATTRFLMCNKIIADSPGTSAGIATRFRSRFITEVRTLLEYDEDFFDSPNVALRNLEQWNNADRITLALNSSPARFPLTRLMELLDELGLELIPDTYANEFLAFSPAARFKTRRLYPLSPEHLRDLRRDVAAHFLRFNAVYGDMFLESISNILKIGTYRVTSNSELQKGLLRGYHDLVVFDNSGSRTADPDLYGRAHEEFLFLKDGGAEGRWYEKSKVGLEHLPKDVRSLIYRGEDILQTLDYAQEYSKIQ